MKELRNGLTTGTCAAASLKAALLLLQNNVLPTEVSVLNPQNQQLKMQIAGGEKLSPNQALAWTIKDAGDDIDVTHGAQIWVKVTLQEGGKIQYLAGTGVGIAKKPGLFIEVGQPAINPGPKKMLDLVLQELLPPGWGAEITISVPGGQALAEKTLNPMLGIEGGISIIGTTGIVRPMSEEAFKDSLVPQFAVLKESGSKSAVLIPGKIGEEIALKYKIQPKYFVQTSNFLGFMLDKAVEYEFKEVLIFGHLGKLIKLAGGIFHTHSHVADARQEIFAAYLASIGAGQELIKQVLTAATTEAIMQLVKTAGLTEVYQVLAEQAAKRCSMHVKGQLAVGIAFADISGQLIALDENARRIGEEFGWNIS